MRVLPIRVVRVIGGFILGQTDLVVTVDTAVAHLAGALGKPTWMLLPYAPDWRWCVHNTTTPWYPTMRLFRQAHRDQWPPVIATLAAELRRRQPDR